MKDENLLEEAKEPTKAEPAIQTKKNLCWNCNKKVGLLGFSCKCTYVFCAKHRYAEDHDCGFDFKQADREKLAKENPLIKSDKVQKF
eukprot:NODE_2055_length_656_cov_253.457990_g1611_i0.p1 GENE.NODE_2055_length_656_cov_253.457990_g1611_i0~~NODE_2055_length_656_cov_253.457990_g1611_i0.p1  ORF type:complete len:87 (+),score=7.89 NODE_2055_length_656_cov_253.457990_g1611_i0:295-555(+)